MDVFLNLESRKPAISEDLTAQSSMAMLLGNISFIARLLGCFFLCPFVFSQELEFHPLSERVQLPASETYNIIQDKEGFIWFATEAGYCRYSNNHLKVFGKAEGLPEKVVYASTVAPDGKLWVATRERRILYFEGESFVEAAFSKNYIEQTKVDWGYPLRMFFAGDTLVIVDQNGSSQVDLKTGKITVLPIKHRIFSIFRYGNNFAWNSKDLFTGPSSIQIIGRKSKILQMLYSETQVFCLNNNPVVMVRDTLVEIDNHDNVHKYYDPGRVLSAIQDHNENILIGFLNKGLHFFPKGDLKSAPVLSLSGLSVSGILQDANGGIWCTTLEKGVFYCQSTEVLSYQNVKELSGRVSLLKSIPGQNILAISNSGNAVLKIQSVKVSKFLTIPNLHAAYNIQNFGKYWYLASSPYDMIIDKKTGISQPFERKEKPEASYSYGIVQQGNRTVCFRYKEITELVNRRFNRFIYRQFLAGGRIRCVVPIENDRFLLFGTKLLMIYNLTNDQVNWLKMPSSEISCALIQNDNTLLLGTKDKGLFLYDIVKQEFHSVAKMIPTQVMLSVYKDKNSFIWVGTNQGAFRLSPDLKTCVNISRSHALPLSETRQITEDEGSIYLGTNDGVYSIRLGANLSSGNIYAPRLTINQEKQTVKILLENNFYEDYSSTWYFVHGVENQPKTRATSNIVVLNSLPPGDYTFYAYTQSADGRKSAASKISFTIEPTLFQSFWFRMLILAAMIGVVILVIRWRISIVRKKEEEKNQFNIQLADFQMSALQAQMNPHFIFNAINTIQSYILTQNRDEAYRFLNKFSNLIRLVLHHSQEKLITLFEELEVIKTYLELEQARFANFEYEIAVAEDIDIHEVLIPPMVVQPYIENAIWHGLNNLSTRSGKLILNFSLDDEYLLIVVEDNGIGRTEAAKHQRTVHKSVGMKITQKRLETLKTLFEEGEAIVEIQDKIDEDGPCGTVVIVKIPLF